MNETTGRRRGPKPPIPLTVLTGFLGAGKTSLLNRLLADPALADTMVIVNEFGDIGLDHLLVEQADEGLVELSSGCLCCTIRGDLIATLEDLLRRRDNDRIRPFTRIVVETTGLADPAPILHTIMSHPYLVLRYRLDGVVTVIDAVNGMATLDAQVESVKQAAVADRLVLTKTDLDGADTGALPARLRALNPAALILNAAQGEASAEALLGAGLFDLSGKSPDVARWLSEEAYAERAGQDAHDHHHGHDHHGHDHHGHDHHGHAHDVNRHDAHIRAFCVTSQTLLSQSAFDMFVDLLRSMHGPQLLRLKGIVGLAEAPDRPIVVHGVQHVFHPPIQLESWPDGDRRTRLVLIARDLEPEAVQKLLDAFAGKPGVDAPDAAGLAGNPLATGGAKGGLFR